MTKVLSGGKGVRRCRCWESAASTFDYTTQFQRNIRRFSHDYDTAHRQERRQSEGYTISVACGRRMCGRAASACGHEDQLSATSPPSRFYTDITTTWVSEIPYRNGSKR